MKVLMISGDAAILREGSDAHKRYQLQAAQVDGLAVYVRNKGESKLAAARRMIREGGRGSFDVVTAQDPFFLGFIAWRIARKINAKLQLQVHTDLSAQGWCKRTLATFTLCKADSVRVVSEKVKKNLEPLHLRAPIFVLPIFVDIEAVCAAAPAEVRGEFPQFKKIILVASRLEPEKNVEAALKAMPEILKAQPSAGLLIAGSGSQKTALEELAKNLGIVKSVVFLGYRSDIFSLYKSADVVLNPSWYEGYGASIVEALAAGVPVVSADVGVAKEAGAIVAPREQFASAILEVLQNGTKGALTLPVLGREEWAKAWKNSL